MNSRLLFLFVCCWACIAWSGVILYGCNEPLTENETTNTVRPNVLNSDWGDTSLVKYGNHTMLIYHGISHAFSIVHDPDCDHDGSGLMRDYQIELTETHYIIYDKARVVGVIKYDDKQLIDKVFLRDNE